MSHLMYRHQFDNQQFQTTVDDKKVQRRSKVACGESPYEPGVTGAPGAIARTPEPAAVDRAAIVAERIARAMP